MYIDKVMYQTTHTIGTLYPSICFSTSHSYFLTFPTKLLILWQTVRSVLVFKWTNSKEFWSLEVTSMSPLNVLYCIHSFLLPYLVYSFFFLSIQFSLRPPAKLSVFPCMDNISFHHSLHHWVAKLVLTAGVQTPTEALDWTILQECFSRQM